MSIICETDTDIVDRHIIHYRSERPGIEVDALQHIAGGIGVEGICVSLGFFLIIDTGDDVGRELGDAEVIAKLMIVEDLAVEGEGAITPHKPV